MWDTLPVRNGCSLQAELRLAKEKEKAATQDLGADDPAAKALRLKGADLEAKARNLVAEKNKLKVILGRMFACALRQPD